MAGTPPSVSTSRIFAVPQLDEDSLLCVNGTAPGGTAAEKAGVARDRHISHASQAAREEAGRFSPSTTSNGNSNGAFTLVADTVNLGSGMPSPTRALGLDELAFLRQQQQAVVAAAAAQLEQDYFSAQALLQQAPRPVLLAVLTSLIDDYPTTLVAPVKERLEHFFKTNAVLKTNMASAAATTPGARTPASTRVRSGRRVSAASFVPNTGATPWTPSAQGTAATMSSATTPYSPPHSTYSRRNNTSGGGKGKGHNKDEQMCSIHHTRRAVNHLQVNAATGLYECIHGFHCLVDEPAPAKTPTVRSTYTSNNAASTPSGNGGYTVVGTDDLISSAISKHEAKATTPAALSRFADPSIGLHSASGGGCMPSYGSASSFLHNNNTSSSGAGLSRGNENGSGSGQTEGSSPADEDLLAYTLQLLQSVRDIEEEE